MVFVTLYGWRLVRWPDATHTHWQIPVSHRYSDFSSWWAHGCPKHVEKRNKHTTQKCAPSWIYLQKKSLAPTSIRTPVRPARSLPAILTYKIVTNVLCYFILYYVRRPWAYRTNTMKALHKLHVTVATSGEQIMPQQVVVTPLFSHDSTVVHLEWNGIHPLFRSLHFSGQWWVTTTSLINK